MDAEVQGAVHGKRVTKKEMDKNNNEETKKKYKEAKKWSKRAVARVKAEAYQHLHKSNGNTRWSEHDSEDC